MRERGFDSGHSTVLLLGFVGVLLATACFFLVPIVPCP